MQQASAPPGRLCLNTCRDPGGMLRAHNGQCEDPTGSSLDPNNCPFGTDCADCGARYNLPTTGDPPPPQLPSPPSPPPRMPDTACCDTVEVAYVGGASALAVSARPKERFKRTRAFRGRRVADDQSRVGLGGDREPPRVEHCG